MNYLSWIIGTAILWVLKSIGTAPLAKFLTRTLGSPEPAPSPFPEHEIVTPEAEGVPPPTDKSEKIPTGYYILADVIVMSVGGLILGLVTGSFFIGISFSPRNWPGMLAFIAASFVASLFSPGIISF
jgi:hypothetical protein